MYAGAVRGTGAALLWCLPRRIIQMCSKEKKKREKKERNERAEGGPSSPGLSSFPEVGSASRLGLGAPLSGSELCGFLQRARGFLGERPALTPRRHTTAPRCRGDGPIVYSRAPGRFLWQSVNIIPTCASSFRSCPPLLALHVASPSCVSLSSMNNLTANNPTTTNHRSSRTTPPPEPRHPAEPPRIPSIWTCAPAVNRDSSP